MERFFKKFVKEDKGAVTVDWVVLTAGVVGLAAAVIGAIYDGNSDLASESGSYLTSRQAGSF